MPIIYGPGLPPIPDGLTPATIGILREQLEEDTLQVLLGYIRNRAGAGFNVFNVLDYDVLGDGINDDRPGIQAAYDAAAVYGGIVQIPPPRPGANYLITRPLWFHGTNSVLIQGPGRELGGVRGNGFGGPLAVIGPNINGLPMTTSKVPGGGLAADFRATAENYTFNLRLTQGAEVNGFAQFCYETIYTMDPLVPGQTRTLVWTAATRMANEAQHLTIDINVDDTGQVAAQLTVGGVIKTVNTGAFKLTAGVTYHIAVAYDGATVRIFAAQIGTSSVVRGSVAATGTITQARDEDMSIGPAYSDWPAAQVNFQDAHGIIDWIRISNNALYTGTFTAPNVKETVGNIYTRLLITFNDNVYSNRLIGGFSAGHGNIYLPVMTNDYVAQATVEIFNLQLSGGAGLYAFNAVGLYLERVLTSGGNTGFYLKNNCYLTQLIACRTSLGSVNPRFSLATRNAIGVCRVQDFRFTGGDYGMVLGNFSGAIDGVYGGADKVPIFIDGAGSGGIANLSNVVVTNEGFNTPTIEAMLMINQPGNVKATQCTFEALNGATCPLIKIDHPNSGAETPVSLDSCLLNSDPATVPARVRFANSNPVKGSVKADNCVNFYVPADTTPWSDPANLVTVDGVRNVTGVSSGNVRAKNLSGTVTFGAADTTKTITFATAETDAAFQITLSVGVGSGAPTAGSKRVSWATKSTGGFVLNVEAAPGVGASVVVDWSISRSA